MPATSFGCSQRRLSVGFVLYLAFSICVGLLAAAAVQTFLGPTSGAQFTKLVFRSLEVACLVSVAGWLWMQRELRWSAWGVTASFSTWGRHLMFGWLAGVAMIGLVAIGLLVAGARELSESLALLPGLLVRGVVVGIAVSLIEEAWFRGGLLTALAAPGLTRRGSAVVISSLFFSSVHFIEPGASGPDGTGSWFSAWDVFAGSFGRFTEPEIAGPAVALFLAGIVLALIRVNTQCIAGCIGLHAGWVTALYAFKRLSVPRSDGSAYFLAAGYDGVVGWFAATVFLAVAFTLLRWRSARESGAEDGH